MALGDDRRASGKAMEQARRDSGKAMESSRRGTTAADVNALMKPERTAQTLPEVQSRGSVPEGRSSGTYTAPASGGGGGISGPLVEVSGNDADGNPIVSRTYHDTRVNLYSSDYLMAVEVLPLKTIQMKDGSGGQFQMQFAKPKIEKS